jgi:putative ABC transport system substrate-binding protein
MKRREFITLLGGAAAWPIASSAQQPGIALIGFLALFSAGVATWPFASHAQPSNMPVIGILVAGTPPPEPYLKELREGLETLRYVEGRNVRLEIRNAEGNASRLPGLAAELAALKVDVIMAFQTPAVTAASRATSDIPIVMAPIGDALGTGLVTSLARPGGNLTGVSAAAAEVAGKTVQLFKEVMPSARRVGILANEADPFSKPFVEYVERDARTLGLDVETVMVRPSQPMAPVFENIASRKFDALMIQGSLSRKDIADLAVRHGLPAISHNLLLAKLGGLMAYAANQEAMYRRATSYVDRILKGAKPSELPIEQPTKYELVINLKTAKALDITFSPMLLARADEVIE